MATTATHNLGLIDRNEEAHNAEITTEYFGYFEQQTDALHDIINECSWRLLVNMDDLRTHKKLALRQAA